MQLKWFEDFLALAQTRSFSRAAEQRHVTHPAFKRRIKALETWAGTPLVERECAPLTLTPAGVSLLDNAQQMVDNLKSTHEELLNAAGRHENTVTLATGRTLARTLLADLLQRVKPLLAQCELHILTGSLTECAHSLERGEVDFMLIYLAILKAEMGDRLLPWRRCSECTSCSNGLPHRTQPWKRRSSMFPSTASLPASMLTTEYPTIAPYCALATD